MEVMFLRHGETDWNRDARIQGGVADIDLNAMGVQQAERTRDGLLAAGYHFDAAFVSPYRRARHTAEILLAPYHLTASVDERLHEMNFGPYEGSSIHAFVDDNIRAAFKDPVHYTPQPGGESFAAVEARVRSFLDEVIKPLEGHARSVIVIAHGGILRTLTRILDRRPLADFWSADHQPNCCAHLLKCNRGEFTLGQRSRLFC